MVTMSVVFVCYRPRNKDKSFAFTFLLLNVMVFFTCFAMKKLELELGMALGLFAIFGILRYRTDTVPVKEMTYLFVIVGVAVINALSNKKTSYAELAVTNLVVIGMAFTLERAFPAEEKNPLLMKQSMVYDNLLLLDPTKREALIQDIRERTGLVATDIKVGKIDLQKGTASITVHHERS
jgi:hypothetical protein